MARPVKLCTVTRLSQADFFDKAWLGLSLRHFPKTKWPRLHLIVDNGGPDCFGLSQAYNLTLDKCADEDILVLCHDDVYLHDWLLIDRLQEAIERFDVVGLAGGSNTDPRQPSWGLCFDDDLNCLGSQPDFEASGIVAHSDYQRPMVNFFGETPAPCELLDGLFLAIDVGKVRAAGARFDERFRFHCYDIDFCRTAGQVGLRLGTWPLNVTHKSEGNYDSPAFKAAARVYLDKWASDFKERLA